MMFSLILATVGRTMEVENFLRSLDGQIYRDFELIVVDQNPDARLAPILASFVPSFPIIHLRSEKGLSKARNVGLKHISGDVVALPDDDCWYPSNLLSRVTDLLQKHPEWDGVTGCSVDSDRMKPAGHFSRKDGYVDMFNVWRRGISFTIFIRRGIIARVGGFDETLGVGADTIYSSGEETDYLLHAIEAGFKIFYSAELFVYHPSPITKYTHSEMIHRAYGYGCGYGRVLKKHRYPLWFKACSLLAPLSRLLLSAARLRLNTMAYHWNAFKGRLKGMD